MQNPFNAKTQRRKGAKKNRLARAARSSLSRPLSPQLTLTAVAATLTLILTLPLILPLTVFTASKTCAPMRGFPNEI